MGKLGKLSILFFIMVFAVLWFAANTDAQEEKKTELKKKIAEITRFKGEVLARTKMVWREVKEAPYPLFSDDKVVTKKGRAEIVFKNGGILRLGLDSEVKISERKEEVGLIRKRIITKRTVKVLLGEMTADMKRGKDQEISFRTPTMVAGIRGTKVYNSVSGSGDTSFGADGPVDTSGSFNQIDTWPIINPLDDRGDRDPGRAEHPMIETATQATRQQQVATELAGNAEENRQNASKAAAEARANPTPDNMSNAANTRANAAESTAETANAKAQASVTTTRDAVLEAQQMRDPDAASQAQGTLDLVVSAAQNTTALLNTTRQTSQDARRTTDPREALAHALTANTNAIAARTHANLDASLANLANAQANSDASGVNTAMQFTERLQNLAQNANNLAQNAGNILQQVRRETTQTGIRAGLTTLQAIENATSTQNAAAVVNNNAANMASVGDTEGLARAAQAVERAGESAQQSLNLVQNAQQILQSLGQARTNAGARVAADALQVLSNSTHILSNATSAEASLTIAITVGDEEGETAAEEIAGDTRLLSLNTGSMGTRALELGLNAINEPLEQGVIRLEGQMQVLFDETMRNVTEITDLATNAAIRTRTGQNITGQSTGVSEQVPTIIGAAEGEAEAEAEAEGETEKPITTTGTETTEDNTAVIETRAGEIPRVTSIASIRGRLGTNVFVVLKGSGFTGANNIAFPAGLNVTGFVVQSDTTIVANILLSSAVVDGVTGAVRVANPAGASEPVPVVVPPFPVITGIAQGNLPVGTQVSVDVSGRNFSQNISVADLNFGPGVTVNSVQFVDSQSLIVGLVIEPGAAVGLRDVTVTNPDTGNGSLISGGISIVLPEPPGPPPTPTR